MIKRPAFCASWVLCAVTGLVLFQAGSLRAQSEEDEDTQSTLKSAVQQELDALYERDGRTAPNMSPSSRNAQRSSSTSRQGVRQTASRSSESSRAESDVQKRLRELYEKDGREMPEMNFPPAGRSEESEDDASHEDERLRQFEEQRAAERDARRSEADDEEEVKKPSLLQRLNPFKGRERAKEAAERYKSNASPRDTRSSSAENARRSTRTPSELNPEAKDPRITESKSRYRFLPRILRPREQELPKEPAARPSEESIANRSRRTMHKPESDLRDTRPARGLDRRSLPHDNESLVQDAPKQERTPAKAPSKVADRSRRQEVDEWVTPSEEKSDRIVKKPVHQEQRKSVSKETDQLETPFSPDFNFFADVEAEAKQKSKEEKRTAERELQPTPRESAPVEDKVASTSSGKELLTAPRRADAEKSAQLPFQDDFPNPFTEVTENEADKRRKAGLTDESDLNVVDKPAEKVAGPAEIVKDMKDVKVADAPKAKAGETKEDNPFTGLKLDEEKVATAPKFRNAPAAAKVAEVKKEMPRAKPARTLPKPAAPAVESGPKVADAGAPNPFEPEKADEMSNHEDPLMRAKIRRLGTRRGQAGLKGFCPVALRDRRDLVDTNPEIASTYEGRLYQFSSAEAKAAFDAEPEKYAPAMGGVDVIVQTNSHQTVDGTLDHAVWFHDKLYLFSSAETLEAFVLSPAEYVGEK